MYTHRVLYVCSSVLEHWVRDVRYGPCCHRTTFAWCFYSSGHEEHPPPPLTFWFFNRSCLPPFPFSCFSVSGSSVWSTEEASTTIRRVVPHFSIQLSGSMALFTSRFETDLVFKRRRRRKKERKAPPCRIASDAAQDIFTELVISVLSF